MMTVVIALPDRMTFGPPSGVEVAMDAMVRVWVPPDLQLQHFAVAPAQDTAREWDGATACGITGLLRWVHGESVDRGATCEGCMAVAGTSPPMEGDYPGPV